MAAKTPFKENGKAGAAPASAPAARPSPKSPFAKRLAEAKQAWETAKEGSKKDRGGFNTLDDGKYICQLTDARLQEGKDDNFGLILEFTVIEGDATGEKASRWCGFDNEERIEWLQRDLRRLGVDVDDFEIEQIEDICESLLSEKPCVRITVKTNGEYKNVYIDKLVDPPETETEPGVVEDGEPAPEETAGDGEPAADSEEAADTPQPGDDIAWNEGKKRITGTVKRITDAGAEVKRDDTKKVVVVPLEQLEILAEVE